MKKYTSLGDLIIDFRKEEDLSQMEFASLMEVDIRTVQRWENNITLLKPEKEKKLAQSTLLPFQLVRNLNSQIVIPTYYDFAIRKYALTERSKKLPNTDWLKEDLTELTNNVKTISNSDEALLAKKHLHSLKSNLADIDIDLILKAAKLLPELNLIIQNESNNYAGHSIVFPITYQKLNQLKKKEVQPFEITRSDLVDYKNEDIPIFYNFDIHADHNENVFYLARHYFNFFTQNKFNHYRVCSFSTRNDTTELNQQLGLNLIWEIELSTEFQDRTQYYRFYEGDFNAFLKD